MVIMLDAPDERGIDGLREAVAALSEWQDDAAPMQLHPGDIGWYWRTGAETTVAAVRTWRRNGRILAVGLLDGPRLLRLTTAPDVRRDEELARQLAADATAPERGVLPAGEANVEAPRDAVLLDVLSGAGWRADEPWTPLRRDLTAPVEDPGVWVETVGPERVDVFTEVHRSAFGSPRFTSERWHAMATGFPYEDARCLLAHDADGNAVAVATVWSAGPGRPGLLEPVGVHAEHRGRGHGRTVTLAAAGALRAMGASSALVATPSANAPAVATYRSAGFHPRPETRDLHRPPSPTPQG
ncbi:GNAT family N-acetyltransferase [Streptomyces sp. NPDC048057]|uniref:GNAT family N-acetyltransferase n=1 Tax=Streptomyces sp. NPDC048057 TaxID=3155628 RepID=UPI0033F51FFE